MTPEQHRVVLKVATLPAGVKDVDELLRRPNGDALFRQAIDQARPSTAWMIDNLEQQHEIDTPEGKQDAAVDMVATLASLPVIERGAYVRRLSVKLGVPEAELRLALNECWRARHALPWHAAEPAPSATPLVDLLEL